MRERIDGVYNFCYTISVHAVLVDPEISGISHDVDR